MADSSHIRRPPAELLLRAADAACEVLAQIVRDSVADADGVRADSSPAPEAAGTLRELFTDHADWFNAKVADALASDRFNAEQRAEVRRAFKIEDDDFAARALEGSAPLTVGDAEQPDAGVARSLCRAGFAASSVLMSVDTGSDPTALAYGSALLLATAALCN